MRNSTNPRPISPLLTHLLHPPPMQANDRFKSYITSSTTVRSRSNAHPTPSSFLSPRSNNHLPSSALRAIRPLPVSSPPSFHRHHSHLLMALPNSTSPCGNLTEMNTAVDFEAVASPDGYVSICGFGSLLSEKSARSTFPDLRNFRVGVLRGFRRVFAHIAPIFFDRGIANEETGEVSSLSVEPCEGEFLLVTVFEIKKEEVPSFIERENEFRFLAVVPEELDGSPFPNPAVVCARYSDEEYFQVRCQGSMEIFFQHYGRYNIHKIWRDDILPCRVYLRHCVLAAKNLGNLAYDNFLDHTFISDRRTTIREYLASAGSGIMEEEPPDSLKSRYGG